MQETYEGLGKATSQVNRSVGFLDALTKPGDLQASFKGFTDAIADLKAARTASEAQGADYRARRGDYLAKWEQEIAMISNEQVKESAQARRERVTNSFQQITKLADEARLAYAPFITDLESIHRALAADLTPAGVTGATPTIDKAKVDGAALSAKLDELGTAINTLMGKMKPAM